MSRCKGWDANEGRQTLILTGFTPINAEAPPPPHCSDGNESQQADPQIGPHTSTFDAVQHPGRDATGASAAGVSWSLHGLRTKKTSSMGKKRVRTVSSTTNAKRRRQTSSNISERMKVTKLTYAGDKSAAEVKPQPQPLTGTVSTGPPELRSTVDSRELDATNKALTSVPVYTQVMSSHTMKTPKQQTSIDTVRASPGYGHTLYQGAESSASAPEGVELVQPWLITAANTRKMTQRSCTGPLRRRQPSASRPLNLSPAEEKDVSATLIDLLEEHVRPSSTVVKLTVPMGQLLTNAGSGADPKVTTARRPSKPTKERAAPVHTDEDFLGGEDSDDEALADLAAAVEENIVHRRPTKMKELVREVDLHSSCGGALFPATEDECRDECKVSVQHAGRKPIVRKPFPAPMLDRSPVFGVSNNTVLRTCFRIGEVLNVGCQAVRTNRSVLLELYARVTGSWREAKPGRKQRFLFKDLYHDKPPHIIGTYELWDQSSLWELDSQVFFSAAGRERGVMCRAMARMRRDGAQWRLEILSIWKTSWADVEHVAAIYAKEGEASLH